MFYTRVYNDYQIRDCTYVGELPTDAKYWFELVKWYDRTDLMPTLTPVYDKEDVKIAPPRGCYTIAHLYFNPKEEEFELRSVGMRFLEAAPTQGVLRWIKRWCQHKKIEFLDEECG